MSSPTAKTIKRLFAVSGNQCAFPGCTAPLVVDDTVVAEICHIKARSPDGPRYDLNQDEKDRHAFDNLVLLCPTHHKVIDDDPGTYTVKRLLEIKKQHEDQHIGGPEPSDHLVRQFLLQMDVRGDLVYGDKIVYQTSAPSRPRVSYTPPPPPDPDTLSDPGPLPPGSHLPFHRNALFTGRVEPLKALARTLLHDGAGSTLVTQTIQGMGGIGKTQLAVEFACRYGRYFYGVHWLNAAQPAAIGAEVAVCGQAMAANGVFPNWPAEQPDQIRHTLSEWQQGGPRLIILDNLEKVEAAREWLARLSGGGMRVLLTARRGKWPRDLGLTSLRLDLFTPGESRDFLRSYLPDGRATDADLNALAERLGYLPLALELTGRYLEHIQRMTVADYMEKLSDIWNHHSMQNWRAQEGNPTRHDLDLARTFFVSWEQVEDAVARRLFVLAGHCAPNQPIPCELLEQAADIDVQACDESLSTLTGLGLLEMDDPDAGPTIHPLLAEYARDQEIEPAPLPALASALVGLARAANDQMDQTGSPSYFFPLLPHVRLIAETGKSEAAEDAANLWNSLGYYLDRVADYTSARAAFERALAIDEAVYGPDHSNVAIDVNNLGYLLKTLGNLEGAQAAYERALAIDEAVFGPDHPNVAVRVNNLGDVLQDLGNLEGAQAAYERALAIDEAVFGPDHPDVAIDVNNLGGVLQAMGNLEGAQAAYERALAIFEKFLPPGHSSIETVRNNLRSL